MDLFAGIVLLALAARLWQWNEHLSLACGLVSAVSLVRGGLLEWIVHLANNHSVISVR